MPIDKKEAPEGYRARKEGSKGCLECSFHAATCPRIGGVVACNAKARVDNTEVIFIKKGPKPFKAPKGWVLVPKEPTKEMSDATFYAVDRYLTGELSNVEEIFKLTIQAAPKYKDQN